MEQTLRRVQWSAIKMSFLKIRFVAQLINSVRQVYNGSEERYLVEADVTDVLSYVAAEMI